METFTHIGETIKYLRTQSNLSQEALACGICSREYLVRIEKGKCNPTFELVNQFSNRLGINIYDNYALILQHHDIATHKNIESLNEAISQRNFDLLNQLNIELSELPSFSSGIPYKYLKYSQSIYCSAYLHDYEQAISHAISGLNTGNTLFLNQDPTKIYLSKADLVLAQTLAINLCRTKKQDEGKLYFDFLFQYFTSTLSSNCYIINRNKRFELNFFAHLVYNEFTFFRVNSSTEYEKIKTTINLLNSHNCSNCLPELLFCKAKIEFDIQLFSEARQSLSMARCLSSLLYQESHRKKLENEFVELQSILEQPSIANGKPLVCL